MKERHTAEEGCGRGKVRFRLLDVTLEDFTGKNVLVVIRVR